MKIILSESQFKIIFESISSESILIIGDSHSVDVGYTYSSKLSRKFPNVKIIAQEGKSTSWMKSELKTELNRKSYDKVIIWGGNNDMGSSDNINVAISNIQEMVNMVISTNGLPFVIVGFDQKVFPKTSTPLTRNYIRFQDSISGSITGAVIIPAFNIDSTHTNDGTHGDSSSHTEISNIVSDLISEPVNKTTNNKENKGSELLDRLQTYADGNMNFLFAGRRPIPYNDKVVDIQTALQFLGFSLPEWGVDGKFGPETKEAVIQLQISINDEPTGMLDTENIESLIEELTEKDFKNYDLKGLVSNKTKSFGVVTPGVKIVVNSSNVTSYPSNLFDRFKQVSGSYYETFISDVESIGLDPLIAIRQLYTESAFSPNVINCTRRSSAGAMGIAQFMPGTWPSYGDGGNPCNVVDSLKAYVKFMDYLLKRFPGRPDIAVASYNSGPNLNIYKETLSNQSSFETLSGLIPNETYKYVTRIFQS